MKCRQAIELAPPLRKFEAMMPALRHVRTEKPQAEDGEQKNDWTLSNAHDLIRSARPMNSEPACPLVVKQPITSDTA